MDWTNHVRILAVQQECEYRTLIVLKLARAVIIVPKTPGIVILPFLLLRMLENVASGLWNLHVGGPSGPEHHCNLCRTGVNVPPPIRQVNTLKLRAWGHPVHHQS
jgi:hypothetical protein